MSIHENIRKYRKQRGMTQEGLAEAMGVSCAAVSKWENGQSAPDLSILAALADYFEISVDTLMDHQVKADRQEALLAEMQQAADAHEDEKAASLCEMLLRNYPNDPKVAEACADAYYSLALYTQKNSYMELCIAQTKRLFALNQGEKDTDRLLRLSALANQYQLLGQFEKAKDYYEQSNVGGRNDGRIAYCLEKLGRTEEALTLVSDAVVANLLNQWQNISTLSEIWGARNEEEKACEALRWVLESMEKLDFCDEAIQLILVKIASLRMQLGDRAGAEEAIHKAEKYGKAFEEGGGIQAGASFLRVSKPRRLLSSANCRNIVSDFAASLAEEHPKGTTRSVILTCSTERE